MHNVIRASLFVPFAFVDERFLRTEYSELEKLLAEHLR